jgi:hypothetical protein
MKPFPRHVEALRQAMLDFTCEKDYDRKLIVSGETVFYKRAHMFSVDGPSD